MTAPFRMTFEELDEEYQKDWKSKHNRPELGHETYEFNIKIQKVWIPQNVRSVYSAEEIEARYNAHAQTALDSFIDDLRYDYDWIGATWQEGRSGGWLQIDTDDPVFIDGILLRAPRKRIMALRDIDDRLTKAKNDFIKEMGNEAFWEISPRDWSPRWKKKK